MEGDGGIAYSRSEIQWKLVAMELFKAVRITTALSSDAFTALAQRYTQPLHVFLCGLVHDPELARDLLQETFIAAWNAAQQGTAPMVAGAEEASMRRWLYRVAYRRAVDSLRRRRLIRWESLQVTHDANESFDGEAQRPFEELIAESEAMQRALASLAPEDTACLLLMVVQGFTAQEAAAIIGSSAAAMGKRIGRAKRRLLAAYLAQDASIVGGQS
jgi:RNA polymerase sigma factor (sigma-70 family)